MSDRRSAIGAGGIRDGSRPDLSILLEQIRDEIIALRRVLESSPRRPAPDLLSRQDRASLACVLPAVAGAHGSDPFTARELVDADAPAAVRVVTRHLNARRLGRLFQRAEGQAVDGYVVQRAGVELQVTLWRVLASPGKANLSTPPRPAPDAL